MLADSSKYYLILVDALSNGVSSSPSNSPLQPYMRFPKITVRDMVTTQHELITKVLRIEHVKAVMGVSMGGMQMFQWMVQYPSFMDKAVAIVGSPGLAPYDLLHWQTQIDAIENDPGWSGGNYAKNPARGAEYEFGAILLSTPEHFNHTTSREQVLKNIEHAKNSNEGPDANNKIRQAEAIMAFDVPPHSAVPWKSCRRGKGADAGDRSEERSHGGAGPSDGLRAPDPRRTPGVR